MGTSRAGDLTVRGPTSRCRRQWGVIRDPLYIVGDNIRRWREDRGFTQERFAQHIGLDRAYYGRIERGRQNISIKTMVMLGAALQVDPAEFLAGITGDDCKTFLEHEARD